MNRASGRRGAAFAALIALALAGCSTIPVQGPVSSSDVNVVESNPLYLQIYGPSAGATPEQIVNGFLAAQAGGAADNFETARKFLSAGARDAWNPHDQIMVFTGDLALSPSTSGDSAGEDYDAGSGAADALEDPGDESPDADEESAAPDSGSNERITLTGHVTVNATLDGAGRYTEAITDASQDVAFTLVRDASAQWRISKTPDGVLIQEPNFTAGYRSASLYFLSPGGEFLVPEMRWFPQRNMVTYVMQALLSGPSPWLRDAVETALPMSTRLAIDAVRVDASGVAQVELTSAVLDAEPKQRGLLVAQIETTLTRLPGVSGVQVLIDGDPLSVSEPASPTRDPLPKSVPLGVRAGRIVQLNGRTVSPVVGLAQVTGRDVTALAFGEGSGPVVIRTESDLLELVPQPGGTFTPLMGGINILEPSVDRFGWIWSASADVDGELRLIRPGASEIRVGADWLEGLAPLSLQVSRDGARLAMVSRNAGGIQIDVAGILRDENGNPHGLSTPIPVGASLVDARDLAWVDEVTLAVLGQTSTASPLTVHAVPIGAHSAALTPVEGASSVASGRGQRTLYVETTDGELWSRSSTGTNWTQIATDIRNFTFPG